MKKQKPGCVMDEMVKVVLSVIKVTFVIIINIIIVVVIIIKARFMCLSYSFTVFAVFYSKSTKVTFLMIFPSFFYDIIVCDKTSH